MNTFLEESFEPHSKYRRAFELWEQYATRTEEFDQLHASGRRNGVAIPVNGDEYRACATNARQVMMDIERQRIAECIPDDVWKQAQRSAMRDK